jgi:hypothetical protein
MYGSVRPTKRDRVYTFAPAVVPIVWVENICDDERYIKSALLSPSRVVQQTQRVSAQRERAAFDKRRASETDWGCARGGGKNYAIAACQGTGQRNAFKGWYIQMMSIIF